MQKSGSRIPLDYTLQERRQLRDLAERSVAHGLEHGCALPVNPDDWPASLQAKRSCFVTLKKKDELRGCVGTVRPARSLIEEVSQNAYAAAFRDRRFEPLTPTESKGLTLNISVLTDAEAVDIKTSRELCGLLQPFVDGLILETDGRHGVFLPQVWESLPDPDDFLSLLKRKAGIADDVEPPALLAWRFQVESF